MTIPYIRTDRLDLITNSSGFLIDSKAYLEALFGILVKPSDCYADKTSAYFNKLSEQFKTKCSLVRGNSLSDPNCQEGSIAYHPVFGVIRADSVYDFSSKQLERDFIAAEKNPNISAHFLHINSGGGEAWYLDKLHECLCAAEKPVHAHFEKYCCSAAYYIASAANKITAETKNCIVGCIGTMSVITNTKGLLNKLGIDVKELYADGSDLKNKKYTDAIGDNPEKYIQECLNPLRDQFVAAVKSSRASLAKLDDSDPIFRGEDYSALLGMGNGLVDTIYSLSDALTDCNNSAKTYSSTVKTRNQALQFLV